GPERKWIIRHGLRTLIKDGNPEALMLIGYPPVDRIECALIITPHKIPIGEGIVLELQLENRSPEAKKLLIDYAVTYVRQKGKTGRKVFKWTTLELAAGEMRTLQKKQHMKITSVRALYPGTHQVEILVNGIPLTIKAFELV